MLLVDCVLISNNHRFTCIFFFFFLKLTSKVQINLNSLAEWAGTEFICGKVVGMSLPSNDPSANIRKLVRVEVEDDTNRHSVVTKNIPFDVVSIDIGSTTRDFTTIPGASQYCISTRPISDLVLRIEVEEQKLKERIR
jgi:NADH dehydrogenase FAD-containing subunit